MGATGTHRNAGMTDRAFFENEFPTMLGKHGTVVACASKPSGGDWQRVFYAAVKNNDTAPHMPGKTWALVVLMHTSRTAGEYWNFHYKEMDEDMGPGEDTCPASVLDKLSPTDNEYATQWRERCRQDIAKKAQAKAITHGTVLEFAYALNFGDTYGEATRFRFEKNGRRSWFVALDEQGLRRFTCRISKWQERPFTIVTAA